MDYTLNDLISIHVTDLMNAGATRDECIEAASALTADWKSFTVKRQDAGSYTLYRYGVPHSDIHHSLDDGYSRWQFHSIEDEGRSGGAASTKREAVNGIKFTEIGREYNLFE